MTIEKLEELTSEYLSKMESTVMSKAPSKMNEDLKLEYDQVKQEFINLLPGIFEKYRESFEFNSMQHDIEEASTDIMNRIYSRITNIKRGLQNEEDIEKLEVTSNEEKVPQSDGRKDRIKYVLKDAFRIVENKMRNREINIDWDNLRRYCDQIISKHVDSIEKNVFISNEEQMIEREVEEYINEIKMEMRKDKGEKLEFKDGAVCPVVTDTNQFAKVNQEIANNIKEQEAHQTDYNLELPGDVIE